MILNQVYPLWKPEPQPRGMRINVAILDEIQGILHQINRWEPPQFNPQPNTMSVMQYLNSKEGWTYRAERLVNRVPTIHPRSKENQ